MSSFRRKVPTNTPGLPPGARLSTYNGQVLISTGVASFDDILLISLHFIYYFLFIIYCFVTLKESYSIFYF